MHERTPWPSNNGDFIYFLLVTLSATDLKAVDVSVNYFPGNPMKIPDN